MKWISIEDKLPDLGLQVIVWIGNPINTFDIGFLCEDGYWALKGDSKPYYGSITHWGEVTPPTAHGDSY